MHPPPPPSYEQSVQGDLAGSETKICSTCGNTCNRGHLFCFQCGASVEYTSPPGPAYLPIHDTTTLPGCVPPTISDPPPAYAPPPIQKPLNHTPQAPPLVTIQPATTVRVGTTYNAVNDMSTRIGDRLIYDFEKIACCIGEVKGLDHRVKNNIHPEVNRKGISLEEWREWMIELDHIQKKATSVVGCLCIFCFPFFIPQACLCAMFCPLSMDHPLSWLPCCYGDWYAALKKWMEKVNGSLVKQGMYAKLLTYKPFNIAPRSRLYNDRVVGKDHNYEMSFLAIALTPLESRKLADESWDHGVNDKCTSGIGRCL